MGIQNVHRMKRTRPQDINQENGPKQPKHELSPIECLPCEIVVSILQWVDAETLGRCELVSQAFRELIQSSTFLWRDLCSQVGGQIITTWQYPPSLMNLFQTHSVQDLKRMYFEELRVVENLIQSGSSQENETLLATSYALDAYDPNLLVGETRMGGLPDLPEGLSWPTDEDGYGYFFIAQLNCGQLFKSNPVLWALQELPTEGILFIFGEWENGRETKSVLFWPTVDDLKPNVEPTMQLAEDVSCEALRLHLTKHYFLTEENGHDTSFQDQQFFGFPNPVQDFPMDKTKKLFLMSFGSSSAIDFADSVFYVHMEKKDLLAHGGDMKNIIVEFQC